MSARLLVCTFAFAIAAVSACGGAADSGLFSGSADGGGGGGDSGTVGHDAGAGPDGGTVHVDASAVDAETPKDSAVPRDTSPPPPVDVVACMGTSGCKVGTDACCRKVNGTGFSYACAPLGACGGGPSELEIPCDKQRDCDLLGSPGDVCCVTGGMQGGAADVSCRPATECTSAQGRTNLCDPQMANPCANANLHCQPSTNTIPGYDICR